MGMTGRGLGEGEGDGGGERPGKTSSTPVVVPLTCPGIAKLPLAVLMLPANPGSTSPWVTVSLVTFGTRRLLPLGAKTKVVVMLSLVATFSASGEMMRPGRMVAFSGSSARSIAGPVGSTRMVPLVVVMLGGRGVEETMIPGKPVALVRMRGVGVGERPGRGVGEGDGEGVIGGRTGTGRGEGDGEGEGRIGMTTTGRGEGEGDGEGTRRGEGEGEGRTGTTGMTVFRHCQ